jgi:hypothetical protein
MIQYLTLPGLGGSAPKAPPPPPPPPTQVDANQAASRKLAKRRAAAASGLGGQTANTGGALGLVTSDASTTGRALLGG